MSVLCYEVGKKETKGNTALTKLPLVFLGGQMVAKESLE